MKRRPFHHARDRRAFVLPVVVMLAFIVTLFLVAAFERRGVERLTVERQINEYRRHHEMFGVRAIVRKWLEKSFDQLPQIKDKQDNARSGEDDFAYGFVLPSGAQIRVYVRDGQGTALSDLSQVPPAQSAAYKDFLDRLPVDVPNLRRRYGPPAVSVNAAAREVLAALVPEGGDGFADRVIRSRERKPLDRDTLQTLARTTRIDDEERNALFSLVTFDPALWRLDVRVTDQQGDRQFMMLAQRPQGKIEVYEWQEYMPEQEASAAASEQSSSRRALRR